MKVILFFFKFVLGVIILDEDRYCTKILLSAEHMGFYFPQFVHETIVNVPDTTLPAVRPAALHNLTKLFMPPF
jgi:hypothetical protein